jgi:Arc/MetJ family transcription regulator
LLAKAQDYTGLREKSALVREALEALIERESARRLARLGGTEPDLRPIPGAAGQNLSDPGRYFGLGRSSSPGR